MEVMDASGARVYKRGFSLLEALFAIALLSMALGSFLTILPYALHTNDHDAYYLQAVAAGQEYLDSLRAAAETGAVQPSPPVVAIDPGGSVVSNQLVKTSPGDFTITGQCTPLGATSYQLDCVAAVQWPEAGQTRTYAIESYATQQVP